MKYIYISKVQKKANSQNNYFSMKYSRWSEIHQLITSFFFFLFVNRNSYSIHMVFYVGFFFSKNKISKLCLFETKIWNGNFEENFRPMMFTSNKLCLKEAVSYINKNSPLKNREIAIFFYVTILNTLWSYTFYIALCITLKVKTKKDFNRILFLL